MSDYERNSDEALGGQSALPIDELQEVEELADSRSESDSASEGESTPEYTPEGRFDRVLYSVYRDEGLAAVLKLVCYTSVIAAAYALFYRLALLISDHGYVTAILLCVCLSVPFVAVTVARKLINAARPYELFSFYETPPKNKRGQSFPSRHVFSIFAIGTALCYFGLTVGLILVALGICLAVCRVLLGYHFIRDVVAGAAIGALSGGLAILFISLFQ